MKYFPIIATTILLTGCFDDTSDLQSHIAKIQANTKTKIDPMPEVKEFHHIAYDAESLRSPFDLPKPEAIQEKVQQMSGCLSPDPRRRKQPLEKFSLSDLTMRGTLGDVGGIWALMEASDLTVHRVAVGSYLGLYNGRVITVNQKAITLMELIPDGAGCWVERETVIAITENSAQG